MTANDTNVSVLHGDRDLVNRGEVRRRIQAMADRSKDVDLTIAKQLELLGQEVDELRGASTGFANVAMGSLAALEQRCSQLEARTLPGLWKRLRAWGRLAPEWRRDRGEADGR